MAPSLSLDYSTSYGNGDVGVGWKLSGLPVIMRCPQTFATNGTIQPITLTSSDKFCLQGRLLLTASQPLIGGGGQQQLILRTGQYGADQATYATEIESFSRIVSHNTSGANGPTSFQIYDRSGLIYEFGGTSDSQVGCSNANTVICPSGQTTFTTWALDKVTDTVGNTMTITYVTLQGRIIPYKIDYTSNSAQSLAAHSEIVFAFSPGFRTDSTIIFQAGQRVPLTTLLQSITTSVTNAANQATTVSTYALAYQTGATGVSLLNSVTRTGGSGGTLPAITFGYTTSAPYDMLATVNNSSAGATSFSYGSTTQTSLYGGNPFSGTGAPAFPTQNLVGARTVVSAMSKPNGIGGLYTYGYTYNAGATDLEGRGFLGFGNFSVLDQVQLLSSATQYNQQFPLIGVEGGVQSYRWSGSTWIETGIGAFTYGAKTAYNGRSFDYLQSSTITNFDLVGYPMPGVTNSYADDTYGNQTSRSSSVTQNYTDTSNPNQARNLSTLFSKSETVQYQNDLAGWTVTNNANWIIGRPTSDSVAASFTDNNNSGNNAAAQTRQTTYVPDQTTGLVSTATVQPSSGTGYTLADTMQYDGFGHLKQVAAAGDGQNRVSSTVYGSSIDPADAFPGTVTNALSQSETRQYDQRFGGPAQVTSINGQITSYIYDDLGRPTSATLNDGSHRYTAYAWCSGYNNGTASCPTGAVFVISTSHIGVDGSTNLEPQVSTYYDGLERVVQKLVWGFDRTIITVVQTYNAKMQLAYVSRPYFAASQQPQYTATTYDQLNRPIQISHPDGSCDTFSYAQTAIIAHTGQTTCGSGGHYRYTETDGDGNLIWSQQQAIYQGATTLINTTYNYDGFDDLVKVTDTAGNVTSYTYDMLGRKTAIQDPDAGARTMTYSAYDETVSVLDAIGVTGWTSYDALSRPTATCYSKGQTGSEQQSCSQVASNPTTETLSTWSYDPANGIGLLGAKSSTDGICSSASYGYNSLGQPLTTTITVGTNNYGYGYTYDANHRLSATSTPSGVVHGATYNAQGYLASVVDNTAGTAMFTIGNRDAELHLVNGSWGNGTVLQAAYSATTGRIGVLDTAVQSGLVCPPRSAPSVM